MNGLLPSLQQYRNVRHIRQLATSCAPAKAKLVHPPAATRLQQYFWCYHRSDADQALTPTPSHVLSSAQAGVPCRIRFVTANTHRRRLLPLALPIAVSTATKRVAWPSVMGTRRVMCW